MSEQTWWSFAATAVAPGFGADARLWWERCSRYFVSQEGSVVKSWRKRWFVLRVKMSKEYKNYPEITHVLTYFRTVEQVRRVPKRRARCCEALDPALTPLRARSLPTGCSRPGPSRCRLKRRWSRLSKDLGKSASELRLRSTSGCSTSSRWSARPTSRVPKLRWCVPVKTRPVSRA